MIFGLKQVPPPFRALDREGVGLAALRSLLDQKLQIILNTV